MEDAKGPAIVFGFHVSQLGKYVPGGIWQPVSQIQLARDAGVETERALTAFPVHVLIQAAAGATVGAFTGLLGTHLSLPVRLLFASSAMLVVALHRGWMSRLLRLLGTWIKRMPDPKEIPGQRSIIAAYGWSTLGMILVAAGFSALIAQGTAIEWLGASAFALAWTVGFLAVPFPSGLGIREGILLLALPYDPGSVVAASVVFRLVIVAGELTLIAASGGWRTVETIRSRR